MTHLDSKIDKDNKVVLDLKFNNVFQSELTLGILKLGQFRMMATADAVNGHLTQATNNVLKELMSWKGK